MEGGIKVFFELPDGTTESLWAKPISSEPDRDIFTLMNSPWYAKGVSYLDIVLATRSNVTGNYEFRQVISRSGNSTYRILVDRDVEHFGDWWSLLEKIGCTYESGDHGSQTIYAIDVPAAADVYEAYRILERGESAGIWEFEEGHVGHKLNQSGKGFDA